MREQIRRIDRCAQSLIHPGRGGNGDMAIGSLKYSGRDRGWMIISGLSRDFLRHQPARRLEIEHRYERLQQKSLNPLALAGLLALEQRHQDSDRAKEPGAGVADRDPRAHRSLPGQSGDRHEPAHALRDLVEAGAIAIGAVFAEAADARINQPRIDFSQRLIIDAEPMLDARPIIFDHDIRLRDESLEDRNAIWAFQIQRNAALVALQILEVGAMAPIERTPVAVRISGLLDFQNVRAPVRELSRRGGAGACACQIKHRETGKRTLAYERHKLSFCLFPDYR